MTNPPDIGTGDLCHAGRQRSARRGGGSGPRTARLATTPDRREPMNLTKLGPVLALGLEMPEPAAELLRQAQWIGRCRVLVADARKDLGPRPTAGAAIRRGGDPLEAAATELEWQGREQVIRAAESALMELFEAVELRGVPSALTAAAPVLFGQVAQRVAALVEQAQPAVKTLSRSPRSSALPRSRAAAPGSRSRPIRRARALQAEYAAWRAFRRELWAEATSGTASARTSVGWLRRKDPLREEGDLLRLAQPLAPMSWPRGCARRRRSLAPTARPSGPSGTHAERRSRRPRYPRTTPRGGT